MEAAGTPRHRTHGGLPRLRARRVPDLTRVLVGTSDLVLVVAAYTAGSTHGSNVWLIPQRQPQIRVPVAQGCPASIGSNADVSNDQSGLDDHLLPAQRPTAGLICRYSPTTGPLRCTARPGWAQRRRPGWRTPSPPSAPPLLTGPPAARPTSTRPASSPCPTGTAPTSTSGTTTAAAKPSTTGGWAPSRAATPPSTVPSRH